MTFGDWELFKSVLIALRELDRTNDLNSNLHSQSTSGDVRISITSSDKHDSGIIHITNQELICVSNKVVFEFFRSRNF